MRSSKIAFLLTAALVMVGGSASASPAAHYTGYRLAASAHVSMAQAQQIALKARLGVITDRELEREAGGSGLRYSFDIKAGGKTFEVGVDAQTGKVLESAVEGAHPD